jgi:hypothetical protein
MAMQSYVVRIRSFNRDPLCRLAVRRTVDYLREAGMPIHIPPTDNPEWMAFDVPQPTLQAATSVANAINSKDYPGVYAKPVKSGEM